MLPLVLKSLIGNLEKGRVNQIVYKTTGAGVIKIATADSKSSITIIKKVGSVEKICV